MYSKADIHIHTHHSDGTASVAELLAHVAAQTDLRVIAVTDHDTITGALEAHQRAADYGVEVVIGEEISTAEGHLLALFVEEHIAPGRPVADTISEVHAQGGLCIAAHPFDWSTPSLKQHIATLDLDAVEAFNASLSWPRDGANRLAQQHAASLHRAAVGGSDAHSLATVGRGYTTFEGTTAADLRRAISEGLVGWGGTCWSARHYVDIARLYVRQRHVVGAIKVALSDGASPLS
jgi:predicted metal-dependent phosphoesterase TrpH